MISADQIRDVKAADGSHVGTVDHKNGPSSIKLTKSDSADGEHHLVPLDRVDHVDAHVHLTKSADDVRRQWASIN